MKFGLLIVGDRGCQTLETLLMRSIIPEFVLSYEDNKVNGDSISVISKVCKMNDIKFLEGKKLPKEECELVDKIFVIGWQYMLNDYMDKLIILHDSILPEYKGWAPTVNALINGKEYLGVTAFQPTSVMDTGRIYSQIRRDITYPMKIEKAQHIVADICVDVIQDIYNNDPKPIEMHGLETFSVWRDYEDYFIDWTQSADMIERFIDAVGNPYDGAKIKIDGQILTVNEAEVVKMLVSQTNFEHTGKVINIDNGKPTVICGTNAIKLLDVKDNYGVDYKFKKLKVRL